MKSERQEAEREILSIFALVLAVISTVFIIYAETFALMGSVWLRSDTFAHGLLVVPVMVYLLFRTRYILVERKPEVAWLGLVLLVCCVALWLVASIAAVDVISEFALIAMVPAVLITIFGIHAFATIAFPIGYLVFAVPTGEFLIQPMIELTTYGTVFLLQVTGIPVFQDGRFLTTPTGNFNVEEACSGLRYLIGATAIGVLFAYFFLQSWRKRVLFLCFVIGMTVLANVLRAYMIVVIAHLSDMRLAVGVDHLLYGWVLFGVLLAVIFLIGLRYSDSTGELPKPQESSLVFPKTLIIERRRFVLAGVACFAVLLTGPATLRVLPALNAATLTEIALPLRIGDSSLGTNYQRLPWLVGDSGSMERHSEYRENGQRFFVHILLGDPAAEGRDSSSFPSRFSESEFRVVDENRIELEISGESIEVNQLRLRRAGRNILVNYWFVVGNRRTANPVIAKSMEVWQILSGGSGRTAMVSLAIEERGLDDPRKALYIITSKAIEPIELCLASSSPERINCGMSSLQSETSMSAVD